MTKNKQQSGLGKLSSSVGQGASIADMAYGRRKDVPNQHDNDAEFYSGIAKSFSAPGDRPRGFFANFGAGFAEGAAHSARSKGIKEKKAESDKHQQVMDYFQDVNKATEEQNRWYADREKSIETIKPFAMGGLEVSYSGMDYATGNERMRNIMEQAKIADPSIKGDYVGYVPNSPIVNMRDEDGNIIAMSLSTLVGEDSVKRVQGSYVDQQVLSNKHRELDMKENELKAKYPSYGKEDMEGGAGQSEGQTLDVGGHSYKVGELSRVEKTARSKYQEKVYKDVDAIPKNNQSIEAIETMREVFDRNPNIGSSFINMLDSPDGVDSWWNLAAKKLAGPDLADMEILKKATNDLNLDTILGITGKAATDLLKKAVQAASPSGKLTKKGFDLNASKWEKKAREANELAVAKYEAMQKGLSLIATPRGLSTAGAKTPGSMEGDATSEGSPFGTRWKKVQ